MSMVNGKIRAYLGAMTEQHRYRSWEHCYGYFHEAGVAPRDIIAADPDRAALVLAFYLASWGMYRGSGFLLQYDYTVHLGVVTRLAARPFEPLWRAELGSAQNDRAFVPVIFEAVEAIRDIYRRFAFGVGSNELSDTLVTKVLLGTFGCLPACDTYFIAGLKNSGFKYSYLNPSFVRRVLSICQENLPVLRAGQAWIKSKGGMHYPLMKLVDMHFWQVGREAVESSGPQEASHCERGKIHLGDQT